MARRPKRLMTTAEYRDAIEKLGLSQVAAARFLGVGERTSRRWASGDYEIPPYVGMLLSLMVKYKVRPTDIV